MPQLRHGAPGLSTHEVVLLSAGALLRQLSCHLLCGHLPTKSVTDPLLFIRKHLTVKVS